jgi:aminoglycoside phosphotransferase (APT) family kinase protein
MSKYSREEVFYPKTETRLSATEMLSLKNRYDEFNAKTEIDKIIRFVFNKKFISFEQIVAWGLDHLLYKVNLSESESYIIRINNTSVGDDYFDVEKLVYEKLIESKVQNCKVYHVEKREFGNFKYDFIVLDNLQVGDFEKLLQNNFYSKEEEYRLVFESGKFLKKFHSVKTKQFGFFDVNSALKGELVGSKLSWKSYFVTAFEKNLKDSYDLGFIGKDLIKQTETIIEKHEFLLDDVKPVLLHGDYCDHNIISNKNKSLEQLT